MSVPGCYIPLAGDQSKEVNSHYSSSSGIGGSLFTLWFLNEGIVEVKLSLLTEQRMEIVIFTAVQC